MFFREHCSDVGVDWCVRGRRWAQDPPTLRSWTVTFMVFLTCEGLWICFCLFCLFSLLMSSSWVWLSLTVHCSCYLQTQLRYISELKKRFLPPEKICLCFCTTNVGPLISCSRLEIYFLSYDLRLQGLWGFFYFWFTLGVLESQLILGGVY